MLSDIESSLSVSGKGVWDGLSDFMKSNILLGMDYPFIYDDLLIIRKLSCINIHKMYSQRWSLEA